jgi:glycine/D-amino acid oxidase-like deaminating enzyme
MFSIWEKQSLLSYDYIVVGSGITGLSASLHLHERYPNATIAILERGILPSGASTKNAGFACIGSYSEKRYDLELMGEDLFMQLIEKRLRGLAMLREKLGDDRIGFEQYGGYELITQNQLATSKEQIDEMNQVLHPLFNKPLFSYKNSLISTFGFAKTQQLIHNNYEGQIDTGKMMQCLIGLALSKGVRLHTGCQVEAIDENTAGVKIACQTQIQADVPLTFHAQQVVLCTNAFLSKWLPEEDIRPGRGQVICTTPIPDLPFKGVFSLEDGYYYFRNYYNRILFGGGRNRDFETEQTLAFGTTNIIQESLMHYLREVIAPNQKYEIEYKWSGIMAFGKQKHPILRKISSRIVAGGRLNGMGVAIGMQVADDLINLLE